MRFEKSFIWFFIFQAFSVQATWAEPAGEEELSVPEAVSIELLGRGLLYSVNYDHLLSRNIAVGFGISYWSLQSSSKGTFNAFFIPIYGNYYLSTEPSRLFLTGGLSLYSASIENSGTDKGVHVTQGSNAAGTIGLGYEFRGNGGFLFRAAPYVLFDASGAYPWAGISFGYCY